MLFVDEAYSLYNGSNFSPDMYGMECLTTINLYMSENPTKVIVIFAGYKDLLDKII